MQIANDIIEELELSPKDVFLGQGTLRPDLIESASELASKKADAIKTHHNDTPLVRELRGQVIIYCVCIRDAIATSGNQIRCRHHRTHALGTPAILGTPGTLGTPAIHGTP